jgi:hypothetical protein
MKLNRLNISLHILLVLIIPFFLDQLNGYLQAEKDIEFSISQMYKIPLLVYLILILVLGYKKIEKVPSISIFFFFMLFL